MNIDDPKLTAYALGELSGPERAEIEKQLCDDPDARAFVEETATFGAMLGNAFHAEQPPVELAPEQRSEVIREAVEAAPKIVPFRSSLILWQAGVAALAASVAIAMVFTWSMGPLTAPKLADAPGKETPVLNGAIVSMAPAAPLVPPIEMARPVMGGMSSITDASQPDATLASTNSYTGATVITSGSLTLPAAPAAAAPTSSEFVSVDRPALSAGAVAMAKPVPSDGYSDNLKAAALEAPPASSASDISVASGQVAAMGRSASAVPELSRTDVRLRSLSVVKKAKNIKGDSFTQTTLTPTSTVAFTSGSGDPIAGLRDLMQSGKHPQPGAIRIDALINAFQGGTTHAPLGAEVARCPWNEDRLLLYIRVKNATSATRLEVDFAPDRIGAYRLIGGQPSTQNPWETTICLGSGPSATILYEIVPARKMATLSQRLATIRIIDPAALDAKPVEQIVPDRNGSVGAGSADFQLTAAVAEFGLLLSADPATGTVGLSQLEQFVANIEGPNNEWRKAELLELIRGAKSLD